jgi:hypothetical protein
MHIIEVVRTILDHRMNQESKKTARSNPPNLMSDIPMVLALNNPRGEQIDDTREEGADLIV